MQKKCGDGKLSAGESNSADRLSFQHYNQFDSGALGASLNMINVGTCSGKCFSTLELQKYTKTNVLTCVTLKSINGEKCTLNKHFYPNLKCVDLLTATTL